MKGKNDYFWQITEYQKIPLELDSCVYFIKNNLNNKYYIGSTEKRLRSRISSHISLVKNLSSSFYKSKNCNQIHKDFINQGLENFSCGVLDDFPFYFLLRKRESEFMQKFNSVKEGYNKIYSCKKNHINLTDQKYIKENFKNKYHLRKIRELYKLYINIKNNKNENLA